MKITFLSLLLVWFVVTLQAQYTLISTPVALHIRNQPVQAGHVLQATDTLDVSELSTENTVLLCDTSLQFYELCLSEMGNRSLSSLLKPISLSAHRGFKSKEKPVADLAVFFGNNLFTIVGDTLSVLFDTEALPLTNDHFVVFTYSLGDERLKKKIAFDSQHLIVRKQDLLQGKTQVYEASQINDLSVYTFTPSTSVKEKLCTFQLQFISRSRIDTECKALVNLFRTKANMDVETTVYQFLKFRYGQIAPVQLLEIAKDW